MEWPEPKSRISAALRQIGISNLISITSTKLLSSTSKLFKEELREQMLNN
jgi:hypothetical protein